MTTDSNKKQNRLFQLIKNSNSLDFCIFAALSIAASISNAIGFLANYFLHGIDIPTAFCALCDALAILFLFFGLKTRFYKQLGWALLSVLVLLEFPLLVFAYGPVMYPYMILGYVAIAMLANDKQRTPALIILGLFDVAVIVVSTLFYPYVFSNGNEPDGLVGSAVITYLVAVITIVVCVLSWGKISTRLSLDNDSTTGGYSREGFFLAAQRIIDEEPNTNFSVCYLDVNGFKAANSVYGTSGGNDLLKEVYQIIKNSSLKPRALGRLVSDHFVCIVETVNVNEESIKAFSKFKFTNNGKTMTLKLLCAVYNVKDRSIPIQGISDRLQLLATQMRSGQSKTYDVYNDEMESQFIGQTKVLGDIELAIQNEEFEPYFQPVIDIKTNKIASAEAIARWQTEDKGLVPPSIFIPVLEEKGLISELDEIIFKKVDHFMNERYSQGKPIIPISVNLSRVDFFDNGLINSINHTILNTKLPKGFHRLEVTESAYEAMPKSVMKTLNDFRKLGAEILVDDFGVGYSSLGMITDYEFDVIKLDMKFAQKIGIDAKMNGVIKSLIELAHNLGGKVVAEGVETYEQYEFLLKNGCDFVQGYYFYKPMKKDEFVKLLENEK